MGKCILQLISGLSSVLKWGLFLFLGLWCALYLTENKTTSVIRILSTPSAIVVVVTGNNILRTPKASALLSPSALNEITNASGLYLLSSAVSRAAVGFSKWKPLDSGFTDKASTLVETIFGKKLYFVNNRLHGRQNLKLNDFAILNAVQFYDKDLNAENGTMYIDSFFPKLKITPLSSISQGEFSVAVQSGPSPPGHWDYSFQEQTLQALYFFNQSKGNALLIRSKSGFNLARLDLDGNAIVNECNPNGLSVCSTQAQPIAQSVPDAQAIEVKLKDLVRWNELTDLDIRPRTFENEYDFNSVGGKNIWNFFRILKSCETHSFTSNEATLLARYYWHHPLLGYPTFDAIMACDRNQNTDAIRWIVGDLRSQFDYARVSLVLN